MTFTGAVFFSLSVGAAALGLLAFLLVAAVFFVYLYRAWRMLSPEASLEPFLLGYGAAVFGSLASGALDHTLLTYPHAVSLLWLSLGLGAATAHMIHRMHGDFVPAEF